MQEKKDGRIIVEGDAARAGLLAGAEAIYKSVSTTYGPKGRNVLIEKPVGRAVLTRDGVTVAKDTYFSDRLKNEGAKMLLEASQVTNSQAGDGTTATVVLTYHLLREAIRQIASGREPMSIRDDILKDGQLLLDELKTYSKPLKKGQLTQVATVSSGDPALGQMIAEAIEHIGADGGVITEKVHIDSVEREYIEGYYIEQGFTALTDGKLILQEPHIFVTAKKIATNADFVNMMKKIIEAIGQGEQPTIAFIGEIEGNVREQIINNINRGAMNAVVINTPPLGDMGKQMLQDIATYTGGKLFNEGDSFTNMDASYLGKAEKLIATPYTTSIFGGSHSQEDLDKRVDELKNRIKAEDNEHIVEKIKKRLANLEGRIAVFRIGGATDTEKDEKEFRIEDAIQASRSAYQHGVVPGGSTMFARLSTLELSQITRTALRDTFKKLIDNAGYAPDVYLQLILDSKAPMGFNLRESGDLVDLEKAGILDPTQVIEQVILNATSTAGNMATIEQVIIFENKEDKK